jgi:RNA-directed DNA polymerase
LGNLSTPKTVQKLQKALHAKAKAEAGYRFYALYDKISRDDILAHAYAQCRSNKGAPAVAFCRNAGDACAFKDIRRCFSAA